jgi:hypothetical protein
MRLERKAHIEDPDGLQTEGNAPPMMFQVICSAIAIYIVEYLYAKTDEDEERAAGYAFAFRRFARWIIRRYGPEAAAAMVNAVTSYTTSHAKTTIPGMGSVVGTLIGASLLEIYDDPPTLAA